MIRVAVVVVVALAGVRAEASPAKADELAEAASALAANNQHAEAAAKFAEAAREDPSRPEFVCNVGISYYKADQPARAHLLLKLCSDRTALPAAQASALPPVIASIEDTLRAGGHAQVALRVKPSTSTANVVEWGSEATFIGDRLVWLPQGVFHVTARSEGYVDREVTVKIDGTTKQELEILLERPKPGDVVKPPPRPPVTTTSSSRPSMLPPIATSAVLVGGVVLAVIASGKASENADRSPFALTDEAFQESKDEVSKWNTVTGVGIAAAVVGAGASAFLWYRVLKHKDAPVEITPTAGGAAVTFGGRF